MSELKTKIGLEIHVQLATKSKMFCRCDNNAEKREPNTVVCPVCLGLPGTLPVTNKEAVTLTLKAGLAFNCTINDIAKFDRKHYFYPDLPKGYQISQYDEPFCSGGFLEICGRKIRLNRIHLEEDAGKLIHSNNKSLVDLNRAGTPLMEIVTEPDIESPLEAGEFLRKLQKIVKDVAKVSEASMEKGHLRCDANISVNDGDKMSEIVELKNINSFRFMEKALAIEDARLKEEYPNWLSKTKVTRGYDSKKNETYPQRTKEEAADYRYFPEPDLPPFKMNEFNLDALMSDLGEDEESKIENLKNLGMSEIEAKSLISNTKKFIFFNQLKDAIDKASIPMLGKAIVNNYFSSISELNDKIIIELVKAIEALAKNTISKGQFIEISKQIIDQSKTFEEILSDIGGKDIDLDKMIEKVLSSNQNEVKAYKSGKKQLFGFLMGAVMREGQGNIDPQIASKMLTDKLLKE